MGDWGLALREYTWNEIKLLGVARTVDIYMQIKPLLLLIIKGHF